MLRQWSFAKVALLSAGWVAVCLVAAVAWVLVPAWLEYQRTSGSGSGGVGAVSSGISVFVLAIPLGPPVLLVAAWLLARWR